MMNRIKNMFNYQKRLIHETDWIYMIILDACRYDYFEKLWVRNNGYHMFPIKSPASSTVEWLKAVFPRKYDIDIISANPYIGSIHLSKWKYKCSEHFKYIYDVWNYKYNDKCGCVLPKDMFDECVEYYTKNVERRCIFWFLQPHSPYIDLESGKTVDDFVNWGAKKDFKSFFGYDIKTLYRKNLEYVLPYVYKLMRIIKDPMIITSDHAELLGEYGLVGHPNFDVPELRTVPFIYLNMGELK